MTQDNDSDLEAAVMRMWRRHVHAERAPGEVPPEADLNDIAGSGGSDCVVVVKIGPHAGIVGLLMNFSESERRVVSADTTESVAVKPEWVRIATLEERQEFAEAETRGADRAVEARRADARICGCDEIMYVETCMVPATPTRAPWEDAGELLAHLSAGVSLLEATTGTLMGLRAKIDEQLENTKRELATVKFQHDALRKRMAADGLLLKDVSAPQQKKPGEE